MKQKQAINRSNIDRLRELFFDTTSPEIFSDQELIEFLMPAGAGISHKKARILAKRLFHEFGSINRLIYADKEELIQMTGIDKSIWFFCALMKEIVKRTLKYEIKDQNIINNYESLVNYLRSTMGCLKVEQLKILFLNKKNILIADEIIAIGTIDQISVYPREVIKRALYNEASAIILVHNHPSGITKPSKSDIKLTNRIKEACSLIDVQVHDHIIVSNSKDYFSFKNSVGEF